MSRAAPSDPESTERLTSTSALLPEIWPAHLSWSIALIRMLAGEVPGDRRPLPQRLVDELADYFQARGSIRVTRRGTAHEAIEAVQFTSADRADYPRTTSSAASFELVDAISLPNGRRAILTLQRSSAFSTFEAHWISMVHSGCAWIHLSSITDARAQLGRLSPREREAFERLVTGESEKNIAAALKRSRHTVHSYVKRIYRTLGVNSRAQLKTVFGPAIERPSVVSESNVADDELTSLAD